MSDVLKKILHDAREARDTDQRFLAVFDLDSTLFDLKERQEKILLSFAENSANRLKWPKETSALSKAMLSPGDFGVREALNRVGLDWEKDRSFLKEVMEYWELWFFHNDFLKYDTPLPGAVEFVKALESLDSDIMYLTGRDTPRMLEGTEQSLKTIGFPIHDDHVQLCLKPQANLDDAEFKVGVLKKAERAYHRVWLFENEPVNLNLIAKNCPTVK